MLDIAETDRFLLHEMTEEERREFEARCMAAPGLQNDVRRQQEAHKLVRWFARDAQRRRLNDIYRQLKTDPVFRQTITDIFK